MKIKKKNKKMKNNKKKKRTPAPPENVRPNSFVPRAPKATHAGENSLASTGCHCLLLGFSKIGDSAETPFLMNRKSHIILKESYQNGSIFSRPESPRLRAIDRNQRGAGTAPPSSIPAPRRIASRGAATPIVRG